MNPSPSFLHPALQAEAILYRRWLRGMSLLLFLTLAGMMLWIMLNVLSSGDMGSLLLLALIGLLMLPVVALLGGLLWYLDRWQARRLNAADRLLRECPPVMVRLTSTGQSDRTGILTLIQPLVHSPAPPFYALIHPSLCAHRLLRQTIMAQWHGQSRLPGSDMVAVHDGHALLGRLVDQEKYRRQRRQMQMVGLVVVIIIAAVLAARAVFSA